jgi:predicted nucleic acid-binding protein
MPVQSPPLPIVIDTNIFVHLLNPEKNIKKHINHLLVTLQDTHQLQIDKEGRIRSEYLQKLSTAISNASELGIEKYILEIWIMRKEMHIIETDPPHNLRAFVKEVINDSSKSVDRYLVETAALSKCDLITNDETDILRNKTILKKKLKVMPGVKCKQIDFINSQEAWHKYCPIS